MDLTMEDAQSQCSSPKAPTTDLPPDQSTTGDMDIDLVVNKTSDEGNLGLEDEGGSKLRARNETDHPTSDLVNALDFGERSYFYGERLPDAPNPGLNIEGLGTIGLPLNLRDAKAIIDAVLPKEKGTPDTDQGIWEIEGPKIRFDNPAWSMFINTILVGKVCEALGATTNPPPRCELSKLCLYEVGSQILPRQDSSEAFATFTVVLSSQHIGGKVHVSHATSTRLLDSASLISTAVLAWYTGVTYEMLPITSGYRLALTYSLTDTSETGAPRPEAPELVRGLEDLRCALQEWHQSTNARKSKIEACLLKHKYTPEDLHLGECALKAPDAFRVANVRSVAEQLGYMVILANLISHEACNGEDNIQLDDVDDDDNPRSRRRSPFWWESSTKDVTLEDLVDLNGNPLLRPKNLRVVDESVDEEVFEWNERLATEISISYEALIPRNPFNKDDAQDVPDEKQYERTYEDADTYHMNYYYYRTALVLVHEDDASKVLFSQTGVYFALQKLSQLDPGPPTAGDRKLAELVLKCLNSNHWETSRILVGVAVKWNDLVLLKTAIEKSDMCISAFGMEIFVKAWNLFAFEDIRPTFEMLLSKTKLLGESLEFIHTVTSNASPGSGKLEEIRSWAQERSKIAFTSCKPPTSWDISPLVAVISIKGVAYFLNELFPQLKNPDYSGFYCSLVKSLWKSKTHILEDSPYALNLVPEGSSKENAAFDGLIEKCLDQAILGYSLTSQSHIEYHTEHQAVDIIDGCLLTTRMAPCRELFVTLLKIPGSAREKFGNTYGRLIPLLRKLLSSKNIDVCSPPFIDFFQILVATYLHDVLGSKPGTWPNIRRIGCECASCKHVDAFLLKPKSTETFRYAPKRCTHVESKLDTIADLVSFEVVRDKNPYRLVVTKLPDFMATFQWEARVVEAKTFLKSVGEDDMIAKLMGDRYEDVLKALQGVQRFMLTAGHAAAASASASADGGGDVVSSSLGVSSSELGAVAASPAREPITGTKRKRTPTQ